MTRKKVGLVLGGGGVRGIAHVGVLKVFERAGIEFDAVAGCSIGSVIGAFYAAGRSAEEMEAFLFSKKITHFFDLSVSSVGIKETKRLQHMVEDFSGAKTFEELEKPLYINATNLSKEGRERVFSSGNLFKGIRASISLPGIFAPIEIDGDYYIDGGVVNQAPFSILPKDITRYAIINVTPSGSVTCKKELNLVSILEKSVRIMENEIIDLRLKALQKDSYVYVVPDLGAYRAITTERRFREMFEHGEAAAEAVLTDVQKLFKY
jgi:NTE family protein